MLCRLKVFQQSKGRFPHGGEADADGVKIGKWISNQRSAYHLGKLSAERITTLEGVPGWSWRVQKILWEDSFDRLKAFQQDKGRFPDQKEADADGMRLGNWASRQRTAYHRGKLPAERISALEGLPGWAWRVQTGPKTSSSAWEDSLDRVKVFQQSKDRIPQRTEVDADGVNIGRWVATQREAYHAGKLSAERISALEGVPGWAWRVQVGPTGKTSWENRFNRLRDFRMVEGRLPRQGEVDGDGVKLGSWIKEQRKVYRRKQMSADRIAALEEVPGWSWRERTRTKFDD